MQKRHVAGAAPIAPIEAIRADKVQRARNRPVAIICEEQHNAVLHAFANKVEKRARQIRLPPFARTGILVKYPKGIPVISRNVRAADLRNTHGGLCSGTLLANGLALA